MLPKLNTVSKNGSSTLNGGFRARVTEHIHIQALLKRPKYDGLKLNIVTTINPS